MSSLGLALSLFGAISLIAARHDIAVAWQKGVRLQALAAQIIVTGGMLSAVSFINQRMIIQIFTVALFVTVLVLANTGIGKASSETLAMRGSGGVPTAAILLFWAWLYLVNIWFMLDAESNSALYRVVSGIALIAFLVGQRGRPIASIQIYSASLTSLAVSAIALPITPNGFVECGRFKCTELGIIVQGPFQSGNLFGLAAVVSGALLFAATRFSRRSIVVLLFLATILYTTMARTAVLALVVVGLLLLIDLCLKRADSKAEISKSAAAVTALCISSIPVALSLWLIYTSEWNAFSNRGRIWAFGRQAVSGHEVTGLGIDAWSSLTGADFGGKFDNGQHSEYLLVYFSGGFVGLLLFAVVLYRITYIAVYSSGSIGIGAAVPAAFVTAGIFENIWNPLTVDQATWYFYAMVAVCASVTRSGKAPEVDELTQYSFRNHLRKSRMQRPWTSFDRDSRPMNRPAGRPDLSGSKE